MEIKFTALQIAEALELGYQPNEQQIKAIEAPHDCPSLVVAGAGSGKTDLMSLRVPYLVANGIALPEQILGLTFTRKAAAQLANRINKNLRALAKSKAVPGVWPEGLGHEFTPPTISTYNSYATSLFRDFGLQLGYDADAIQLTEATAFQLARELILSRGEELDPRLLENAFSVNTLVDYVLKMAAELNEHGKTGAQVDKQIDSVIESLKAIPAKAGGDPSVGRNGYMAKFEIDFEQKKIIATLAQAFIDEKKKLSRIDFSDQVALALEAVENLQGQVQAREQERFTQVLLDEYQDTSVLQTKLLSSLFNGKSVMAVGDPHQSIYAWRGASEANLAEFRKDFGGDKRDPFQLSTSWRNPQQILDVANEIARPLDVPASYLSPEQAALVKSVAREDLEVQPSKPEGSVQTEWFETLQEEADGIAGWFAERMAKPIKGEAPKGALLLAKKKHIPVYQKAMTAIGLNVQVVGLGALLTLPEITDIRCALKVISSADAGSELIRLLMGARFGIGAKDIDELHKYATRLVKGENDRRDVEGKLDESQESIVDALDHFYRRNPDGTTVDIGKMEHVGTPLMSPAGRKRMHESAKLFANLRKRIGLPLPELVRTIVAELWLDVELLAKPLRTNPLLNINEFVNVVTSYAANAEDAKVSDLLEYLDYADDKERLDAAPPVAKPGTIQIMTIHASKGLEWHHVAVASFNSGDLPKNSKDATGWVNNRTLPYSMRGDAASLPLLDVDAYPTQTDFNKAVTRFKNEVKEMQGQEQRRLAYVAVTRPMVDLLVTGSYWQPGATSAAARSPYLDEVALAGVEPFASYQMPLQLNADNPDDKESLTEQWPKPIFKEGQREAIIRAATDYRAQKPGEAPDAQDKDLQDLIKQVDILVKEDAERKRSVLAVDFPVRIPASNFKAFLGELEYVAGAYLRPVPSEPYSASRLGNLFHGWVERTNSPIRSSDAEAELYELEDEDDYYEVEHLQKNFEASRFKAMQPLALEQEIQVTIGGNTFICKMDAVYQDGDGIEIVDWKTNKPPKPGSEDERKRSLQLSLYRFAYSAFTGIPLEKIKATFFFVGEGVTLTPSKLFSREEILAEWQAVLDRVSDWQNELQKLNEKKAD
ncbi:MAG: UvrD-helicase domain-containing protein [Micrococcales bacterium]